MKKVNWFIRQETPADYDPVEKVITRAFASISESDHSEGDLVRRLRMSPQFIPEFSLVACKEEKVVGFILLSPIQIQSDTSSHTSLALAPVAVDPAFQDQGIGSDLIMRSHEIARSMGYTSIILIGHSRYYPRFGYKRASIFGIRVSFEVPDENCMALELIPGGLKGIGGLVHYPGEFEL